MSARANCALCWQAPLILLAAVGCPAMPSSGMCVGTVRREQGKYFRPTDFFALWNCIGINLTLLSFDDPGFVKHVQDDVTLLLNEAQVQIKYVQIGLTL